MKSLEQRILKEGRIIDNRVLKVDGFLNHQIDPALLLEIGKELADRYKNCGIQRIITIESSGIAVAFATAIALGNIPIVFGRKKKSILMTDEVYHSSVYSYTKEETYEVTISKKFLFKGEVVLILDDFLASGEAAISIASLAEEAHCKVAGIGIVIEKSFQPGRTRLENLGYRVESLARIAKFENNKPVFLEGN